MTGLFIPLILFFFKRLAALWRNGSRQDAKVQKREVLP
jgi:hypothetical protein